MEKAELSVPSQEAISNWYLLGKEKSIFPDGISLGTSTTHQCRPLPRSKSSWQTQKGFHGFSWVFVLLFFFWRAGRILFVLIFFLFISFLFFCLEKKRKKMKLNGLGGMFFGRVEGGKTMWSKYIVWYF